MLNVENSIKLSLFDFESSSYKIQLFTIDFFKEDENHKVLKYVSVDGNIQYIFVAESDLSDLEKRLSKLNGSILEKRNILFVKMRYFYGINQDKFLFHYNEN